MGNQYSTLVDPLPIKFFYFYKDFYILERVGHHLDHVIALAIISGRTTLPLHNLLTAIRNIWSHIFFHLYRPYNILKCKRKDDYQTLFNIHDMTDVFRIGILEIEVGARIGENFLLFIFFYFLFFFLPLLFSF